MIEPYLRHTLAYTLRSRASLGKSPLISGCLLLANSVGLSIGSISTGIFIRKTGMYLPPIFIGFTVSSTRNRLNDR